MVVLQWFEMSFFKKIHPLHIDFPSGRISGCMQKSVTFLASKLGKVCSWITNSVLSETSWIRPDSPPSYQHYFFFVIFLGWHLKHCIECSINFLVQSSKVFHIPPIKHSDKGCTNDIPCYVISPHSALFLRRLSKCILLEQHTYDVIQIPPAHTHF